MNKCFFSLFSFSFFSPRLVKLLVKLIIGTKKQLFLSLSQHLKDLASLISFLKWEDI